MKRELDNGDKDIRSIVEPARLVLEKHTVRVLKVRSDVRAGGCTSCPSRISHISNTTPV